MKKLFTFALAACVSVAMFAETKTTTFSGSTDKDTIPYLQKEGITLTLEKGSSTSGVGSFNYSSYRIYQGNNFTISSVVGNITKIEFTCDSAVGASKQSPDYFSTTTGTYTYEKKVGTWTGSAASVVFTTSKQVRCSQVVVTYDYVAPAVLTPTFTPEAGKVNADNTFSSTFTLTLSTATEGATIKYTIDGTDPSSTKALTYAEPIKISETTKVRAISVKGDDKSFETAVEYIYVSDEPLTVTEAYNLIASGEGLSAKYYVKGEIKTISEISTTYGNATYTITDGNKDLVVYRGYNLDNTKFTTGNEIAVGGIVIVYGQLVNWSGTYEFTQGNYITSYSAPTAIDNTEVSAKAVKQYDAELGQVVILRNGVKYNALGVEVGTIAE